MKMPHFKVRNPLLSAAPKYKATKRYAYRNGKLVDITYGDPADPHHVTEFVSKPPVLPNILEIKP